MHAQVVRFQGSPGRMENPGQGFRERVLPMLQQQAGFKRAHVLLDRAGGTVLGITLWESEDAGRKGTEAMSSMRNESAQQMGATVSLESYEVVYSG